MLTHERLEEVLSELATRPGHEKVRSLVYTLLVDALGVPSTDIHFERALSEIRGRTDALLGETVFEFKRDLRVEQGDAVAGLRRYLGDCEKRTGRKFLGIATDGATFIAYELHDGGLVELRRLAMRGERRNELVDWLDAAVAVRADLEPDPETVTRELGRESVAYQRSRVRLAAVWAEVRESADAKLKRQLWSDLLEKVYGSDITADDLFFQHTYLSVVAKTMACGALGIDMPEPAALLSGQPFEEAGIAGAVESDFFDWPLESAEGHELLRRISRQTARIRLHAVTHDVLKGLYESLIDPDTRHDLGEYYTPDWLASRMVERAVQEPLTQRVLDPACGSGTFLFHAIRRLLTAADAAGLANADAIRRCCGRVLGVDVHPVAVLIARVTYLLAIGEKRLRNRPRISVPVYLGDSLQWNTKAFLMKHEVEIRVPGEKPLYFPFAITHDPVTFDGVIEAILKFSADGADKIAMTSWLARKNIGDDDDRDRLGETYRRIHRLQEDGKDHIWGYIARNLVRPIWLTTDDERSDVVVGNPPWLSYRFMNDEMQKRFRVECEARGLWEGGKVATNQDLSAYFFARCVELYLKPGGVIAFVMPYAALGRRQFAGFRSGNFGMTTVRFLEGWGFDERVQPLFPVPSCVLIAEHHTPAKLPDRLGECVGELPRRDATSTEAERHLVWNDVPWPIAGTDQASAYRDIFRQGATVVPQLFFRVERVTTGKLGNDPSAPLVTSRRTNLEKTPWKELPSLRRQVEIEFLRPLFLGESIAPFRILEPVLSVVGWDPRSRSLLDAASASKAGYGHLAGWLRQAEAQWREHGKGRMSLLERLDYQGEMSSQLPPAKLRVLYSASGAQPAAVLLRASLGVVEHKLYWASVDTEEEGRYLEAILNSETARARIERLQSRGQWGARDFDKLIVSLPIPKFEATDHTHARLAKLAEQAEAFAMAMKIPDRTNFVKARRMVRDELVNRGVMSEVDDLVEQVLTSRLAAKQGT